MLNKTTAYERMMADKEKFTAMYNNGKRIGHIAYVYGSHKNDVVRRAAQDLGLKPRQLTKQINVASHEHRQLLRSKPGVNDRKYSMGETYKAENQTRKWFAYDRQCAHKPCCFLAVPLNKTCYAHSEH